MPAHPIIPDLAAATRAASRADRFASESGRSGAAHLSVDGVSHGFPGRRVLSDLSFTAKNGDRIGLIGENGTGKSTLLRLISATGPGPDAGTVTLAGTVGLLEQQLPYPDDATLSTVLDDAQRASVELLERLETLGAHFAEHPDDASVASGYGSALDEAERTDAWSVEARRGEMLAGFGLGGIPDDRRVGELSGGQRLRLALASLLLEAPHTLLLDEPSNHLDDAAAAYLERVLRDWPGIVIVASHDRTLLDAVATRILDLDALPLPARVLADATTTGDDASADPPAVGRRGAVRDTGAAGLSLASRGARDGTDAPEATDDPGSGYGARLWGVGYSAARAARQAEMQRWRERYAAETAEREALVHEIEVGSREVNRKHESKSEAKITRKFYADKDARVTARRARNARVRLDTLERERVRRPPEPLRFGGFGGVGGVAPVTADTPRPDDGPLIAAQGVSRAGRLRETSIEVCAGGRSMLTGPNGSGKSTLLGMLAGALAPDRGAVDREPRTRIGYLPQEVRFDDASRSAADMYRSLVGHEVADTVPLTATGLLAPRDMARPMSELSVGQRRRVALAALVADPPDVLLLDEPTNHLSLTLVEELEQALRVFTGPERLGALVIATHDRWMRSSWEGEVIELAPVE